MINIMYIYKYTRKCKIELLLYSIFKSLIPTFGSLQ